MKNVLLSALSALVCACHEPEKPERPLGALRPPGSRVVGGATCFEHETADGWKPIGLVFADGRHPVSGQTAIGAFYFPADAGRVRVVPNCSEEEAP